MVIQKNVFIFRKHTLMYLWLSDIMSATSFQKYQEKILGVRGEGKRRGGVRWEDKCGKITFGVSGWKVCRNFFVISVTTFPQVWNYSTICSKLTYKWVIYIYTTATESLKADVFWTKCAKGMTVLSIRRWHPPIIHHFLITIWVRVYGTCRSILVSQWNHYGPKVMWHAAS